MKNDISLQQVDQELMLSYLSSIDDDILFAKSESVSGEFFLEGLDIRLILSDEDLDKVEIAQDILLGRKSNTVMQHDDEFLDAKKTYSKFIQAHNHELAHLYQVLALPAFQIVWEMRYHLLRLEALVMLQYLENGGVFSVDEHPKVLKVLEEDKSLAVFVKQFNNFKIPYNVYILDYHKKINGVSFFYLIESMAHAISLQLSDEPESDILQIGASDEYTLAFDYFRKSFKGGELQIRWQYLIFIYVCYFSCRYFDLNSQQSISTVVDVFFRLCLKTETYMEALMDSYNEYRNLSKDQLEALNSEKLSRRELDIATDNQIVSLLAFFDLIDTIERDTKVSEDFANSIENSILSDFFLSSQEKGIDWSDKYLLARILIFPENFVWLRDVYDEVMGIKGTGKEFTYQEEADFYRFIMNCKQLLQLRNPIPCCEEHGVTDKYKKILRCKNEDGLAFHLESLIKRPAFDLFKF